jgi:cell division protein FtsL
MLLIRINVNIFLLAALLVVAFLVGYVIRARQLAIHRRKIYELEREMLNNHAQILELEKEKAELIRKYNVKVKT